MRVNVLNRLFLFYCVVNLIILLVGFFGAGDVFGRLGKYWSGYLIYIAVFIVPILLLIKRSPYSKYALLVLFFSSIINVEGCFTYDFVPLVSVGVSYDSDNNIGYFFNFLTYFDIFFFHEFCELPTKVKFSITSFLIFNWILRSSKEKYI